MFWTNVMAFWFGKIMLFCFLCTCGEQYINLTLVICVFKKSDTDPIVNKSVNCLSLFSSKFAYMSWVMSWLQEFFKNLRMYFKFPPPLLFFSSRCSIWFAGCRSRSHRNKNYLEETHDNPMESLTNIEWEC